MTWVCICKHSYAEHADGKQDSHCKKADCPCQEYSPVEHITTVDQAQWDVAQLDRLRTSVLADVSGERDVQDVKWGDQKHDIYRFLAILGEEVGEVNKAALHTEYGGAEAGKVREELVQVAAVAVKIIENMDRGLL